MFFNFVPDLFLMIAFFEFRCSLFGAVNSIMLNLLSPIQNEHRKLTEWWIIFLMEPFSLSFRLFWATGDEIRTHTRSSDHCLQRLQNSQHGHVHMGTEESAAGQAGQSECLDLRPQWPVTMVTGNVYKNCLISHCSSSLQDFLLVRWISELLPSYKLKCAFLFGLTKLVKQNFLWSHVCVLFVLWGWFTDATVRLMQQIVPDHPMGQFNRLWEHLHFSSHLL